MSRFTAYGLADTYSRPSVRPSVEQGGFSPRDLFGELPGTLVIVAPESDVERFVPLFTALIAAIVHEAEERAAAATDLSTPGSCWRLTKPATSFATLASPICSPLLGATESSYCSSTTTLHRSSSSSVDQSRGPCCLTPKCASCCPARGI